MSDPESEYLSAMERIINNCPIRIGKDRKLSQRAVAMEAGRDPTALKSGRYKMINDLIKQKVAALYPSGSQSSTARLTASRAQTKLQKEANSVIAMERDKAFSLLVQAHAEILSLRKEIAKLKRLIPTNVVNGGFRGERPPSNF